MSPVMQACRSFNPAIRNPSSPKRINSGELQVGSSIQNSYQEGCRIFFGYMEEKTADLAANTSKVGCQGSGEAGPNVESVGNPPGKRVRMKQCSFGVINKDGSRVLGFLAANKGSDTVNLHGSEQNAHKLESKAVKSEKDEKLEPEGKRKRPLRQCVESRREQMKSYDVDEGQDDCIDAKGSLKDKKGGRAKVIKTSKKMDGVGIAIQSGEHQSTDSVVTGHSPTSDQGLDGQPPVGPTAECTLNFLEKDGSDFFLSTSKKLILKQQKLKSETPDLGSRSPDNVEAASEKRSKRCKHVKDANVNKGHSPQNASTKQHVSKRKQSLLENQGQVNAPKDGNGAKLSKVSFDLRLEAKQAAQENVRLSAGKGTHPFFMQQRPTQTRVTNCSEEQFEVNQQNTRLLETIVEPCPPFHITQNDQVEVSALDWKGWEFVESNIWQQDDPKVLKEALKSIPKGRGLLKSGIFSCFSNGKEHSLDTERNTSQDICFQHEPLANSGGVDRKKQMEKLFVYLESRAKHKGTSLSAEQSKDSLSNLSLKDIEERFMSYHFHRSSGMNNLWTDKYQPETCDEVCGNSQSVVLLNDWLRCWREWVFGSDKEHIKENEINCPDEDWGCFQDEDETSNKDSEGDGLKNILLLTGPVGCGKSAALYACAKEQGFDVIEVNASECRSGALVKQKFGEAMESHGLNQRAVEDVTGMNENKVGFDISLSGKSTEEKGNTQSKVKKEKQTRAVCGNRKHQMSPERGNVFHGTDKRRLCQSRSKALILFEDVDTIFDDDRGFMGALLQIAETAKRPIVLTSNRRNPSLPRLLDRLTIQLELPSMEELVSHAFMVCIAEGILISPSLVEHVGRCCYRDLRKTLMLLQFWCQGNNDRGRDGCLSQRYSSIPFELDMEHRIIPKMMPWSFPCKLSEAINMNISKVLDEEKEQVWLNEAKLAEEHAAREKLVSQIKNRKRKWTKDEKKSWMLNMHSFDDDTMQTDRELDNQIDELSKVTLSSAMSLDHRVRRRRCAVVFSDSDGANSDGANSGGTHPAISETQLQDPGEESPVETISKSDDMTFSDPRVSGHSPNQKGSQQGREHSPVFRRLRKMQNVDLPETSSLMDVSCVQESALVSETLWNCNNTSQVKLVDFENTSREMDNSISNTCSPFEVTQEHHNMEFLSKEEDKLANCEKETEMVVESDGFTASQTGATSSDAHSLKCKENADDKKLNLTWCMHNKEKKNSVPNTIDRLHDRKCSVVVYETLPLMDECSRVDFDVGSYDRKRQELVGTGYPVQKTWLKMQNSCENFKSLLDLGCKDALSAIDLVTTLTDLISSGDLLISSCGLDNSDVCKPLHVSRDFNLHGDDLPASCFDERTEIAAALGQQGLSIMIHNLGNEGSSNLDKEMLTASTDSVAVGKLILAQGNDEMICNDEFSKIDLSATEHQNIRQAREIVLSDTLDSLIPLRSHFMSKGVAFHEYTSFLGRIAKLEESRLLQAKNLKRRTRGRHHYLSTGRYSTSPEDIFLLGQYSTFGKAPGR